MTKKQKKVVRNTVKTVKVEIYKFKKLEEENRILREGLEAIAKSRWSVEYSPVMVINTLTGLAIKALDRGKL